MSFFRKAFGWKRSDDKDFDDFLNHFHGQDIIISHDSWEQQQSPTILFKDPRDSMRFVLMGSEGLPIYFDSLSSKPNSNSMPVFSVGADRCKLADLAFGSYSLRACKDLLYTVRFHDLSSVGYLLLTRTVSNLDDWYSRMTAGKQFLVTSRSGSSSGSETRAHQHLNGRNSVAACLLFKLDDAPWAPDTAPYEIQRRTVSLSEPPNMYIQPEIVAGTKLHSGKVASRRFYRMLFEHCIPLSLLVESLAKDCFKAVYLAHRGRWGSMDRATELKCFESVAASYATFVELFRDFCTPRLQSPVWSTMNRALNVTAALGYNPDDQFNTACVNFWLNSNSSGLGTTICEDYSRLSYDLLSGLFIRSCLNPLINRGFRGSRHFIGQLVTGLLMLHPGWVASLLPESTNEMLSRANRSAYVSTTNHLLNQLLSQIGCMEPNLTCSGGSIFNCTVITGQSKKLLLALLYLASYFLRFTQLMYTNEVVPDLGQADMFEVDSQRRQSRSSHKGRRKSGSGASTGGDTHDSGISSQEDLTMSLHSASTGSSPIHANGVAVRGPRLTQEQCRIAERAAHVMVSREMAAAAAGANPSHQHIRKTSTAYHRSIESDLFPGCSGSAGNSSGSHAKFIEIPLLIEKYLDKKEDICACVHTDLLPVPKSAPIASTSSTTCGRLPISPPDSPSPAMPIYMKPSTSSLDRTRPQPLASSATGVVTLPKQLSDLHGRGLSSPSILTAHMDSAAPTERDHNFNFSQLPDPANHGLIGHTVTERFAAGLVLQSTTEQYDSFKFRLREQMMQWLHLGPLAVKGMDLSIRSSEMDYTSPHADNPTLPPPPSSRWCGNTLLVNADLKTVEVLTFRLPQSNTDSPTVIGDEALLSLSQHSCSSRHSFSEPAPVLPIGQSATPKRSKRISVDGFEYPQPTPVTPAPLVLRLLDHVQTIYKSTTCSALAMRDLESHLYLIYSKSRILSDLVSRCGPSVLRNRNRLALAACCSADDIPLLLSTAASHCLKTATILHAHPSMWWFT